MNCVAKLVKKNDEIWGEIRGANKYTMEAQRAQQMGDRDEAESYLHMAGQELEHKDRLQKMAQNALDKARREGNENIAVLEEMWSARRSQSALTWAGRPGATAGESAAPFWGILFYGVTALGKQNMAAERWANTPKVELGRPNSEPQWKFFKSRKLYTCYGGARGGGKSWAVRTKAVGGALRWAGIKILIIRRTYRDMENSLITPLVKLIPQEVGRYNSTMNMVFFANGSTIKFGHLPNDRATVEGEYQGQEFDWIFMDEATQFTESEFRGIGGCLRGVNKIPKRMYLTCNPGGVGHQWVKRLFIDKKYREGENPDDYCFIPAKWSDNKDLMESSPAYRNMLDNLPENVRAAHRDGNWDALAGQYFAEFREEIHTIEPFVIPQEWRRYRAFDYGLDCFACLWIAVDFVGRAYVYREVAESRLIVSQAAELAIGVTPEYERIEYTIAPPDMWSTQKDTGRTMAEIFTECGLGLVKGNNSRVQGWLNVKEMLKIMGDGKPGLLIFKNCRGLIDNLQAVQSDEKNPSDVAKEPHEITHRPDALRYYCQSRFMAPELASQYDYDDDEEDAPMDYQTAMCGGPMSASYLTY